MQKSQLGATFNYYTLIFRTWHVLEARANLPDDPENNAPYELILLRGLHLMLMAPRTDVYSLNLAPESNGLHCLVHHYFFLRLLLQILASCMQSEEETVWFLLGRLEDPLISRVFVLLELDVAERQEGM